MGTKLTDKNRQTAVNQYSCHYLEGTEDKHLVFMVDATNRCQLKCGYCYYGEKGVKKMDVDRVSAAVNKVTRLYNGRVKIVRIHYMGGEPLLAWDKILNLNQISRKYFEAQGIRFDWSMTSNLIALDEKKSSHMISCGADIRCSIDGPEGIHNRNRPYRDGSGSYKHVVKGLALAKKITPHDTPRVTVRPGDGELLPEIAQEVLSHGFDGVAIFPSKEDGWTPARIEEWKKGIAEAHCYVEEAFGGKKYISTVIKPVQRPREKKSNFSFCGAGRGLWGIGVGGSLFFCHHMSNHPQYEIIDASRESEEEIRLSINISPIAPTTFEVSGRCRSCKALEFCEGGCMVDNYIMNASSEIPIGHECDLKVATVEAIGEQMIYGDPKSFNRRQFEMCGSNPPCPVCHMRDGRF